jgi:hypothetical protein
MEVPKMLPVVAALVAKMSPLKVFGFNDVTDVATFPTFISFYRLTFHFGKKVSAGLA